MQLVEFFLWAGFDNAFWSKVGFLLVMMEPVTTLMKSHWVYTAVYAAYMLMYFKKNPPDFSTKVADNGHLQWNWLPHDFAKFAIPWGLAFFGPLLLNGYYSTFIGGLLIYLFSWYKYNAYGTFSSMWCWFAIFGWILYMLTNNK